MRAGKLVWLLLPFLPACRGVEIHTDNPPGRSDGGAIQLGIDPDRLPPAPPGGMNGRLPVATDLQVTGPDAGPASLDARSTAPAPAPSPNPPPAQPPPAQPPPGDPPPAQPPPVPPPQPPPPQPDPPPPEPDPPPPQPDPPPPDPPPPDPPAFGWWKPTVGMTWDWQLKVPIDPTVDVDVYDIDLFENDAAVIADLHRRGRKVICYVNLGAWESWRPDADTFPKSIIGAHYHGFPDENWLDIRQLNVLAPIVRRRLDLAVAKGCDAVEPDNMDGYDTSAHEPSGFPLTAADQLVYNRFVASEAHARGLGVGLKNDVNQVRQLVDDFDFSVSEQCFQYDECHHLEPFIDAGKPVFEAEYVLPLSAFCSRARAARISAIRKRSALDAWRETCP